MKMERTGAIDKKNITTYEAKTIYAVCTLNHLIDVFISMRT